MAAQFLTRFGEKITKSRLVGLNPLHRSQRLSCFIEVLCTLLLCLLCKTYIGASVCLSVHMHSHMTTLAYLHMCMNTCSMCRQWEAKGTYARLKRPKFDPPSACWVFLSVCWGRRRKHPLLSWKMQRDWGCRRIETPAQQPGAEELTQQTGFSVNTVMLLTSIGSMVSSPSWHPTWASRNLPGDESLKLCTQHPEGLHPLPAISDRADMERQERAQLACKTLPSARPHLLDLLWGVHPAGILIRLHPSFWKVVFFPLDNRWCEKNNKHQIKCF